MSWSTKVPSLFVVSAVLGSSVAHANPPVAQVQVIDSVEVDVNVTNPSLDVAVQGVVQTTNGDPYMAFQYQGDFELPQGAGGPYQCVPGDLIPDGYRLVIQHVTAKVRIGQADVALLEVYTSISDDWHVRREAQHALTAVDLPEPTGTKFMLASQPVTLYSDFPPCFSVNRYVDSTGPMAGHATFSISGYLLPR